MFSYCLVGAWMLYFVYGKNKSLKVITFILTVFIYYIRGYRFIIIIFVLAPIVFVYLYKQKRPKFVTITAAIIVMIIFVGFVAAARNSVRYGGGISNDMVNWDAALEQVKDNFRIYKTYYALVGYVPKKQIICMDNRFSFIQHLCSFQESFGNQNRKHRLVYI